MKRFSKILTNLLAVILLVVGCVSLVGCGEDITTAEVKIQMYDYDGQEFYGADESTLTIDLYGHLAPKTVEAMVKYINEGYYNNALIYAVNIDSITQYMVGDLYVDGDAIEVGENGVVNIKQKAVKPTLPGEFKYGGTTGSDLINAKGSVGLWRTWYSTGSWTASSATDTGSATWFMPTETRTSYNDYFCVFGQIDLTSTVNSATLDALDSLFESEENYTEYVIYYTYTATETTDGYTFGEYDEEKPNCGLVFNCVTEEYYEENIEELSEDELAEQGIKIFETEDDQRQYTCYDKYTIKVPNNAGGKVGGMIKTATIKK